MALLTRDQILEQTDLEYAEVEVPEWGGTLRVGQMCAHDRDAYDAILFTRVGDVAELKDVTTKLVAFCVVDEEGQRVFTEADIAALARKSHKALNRVYDVAAKLNGLGLAGVEDVAKN